MPAIEANSALHLQLLQLIHGYNISQTIYVAAKLGIADLLLDGPKTASMLAKVTGTHAKALFRVMRALSSIGIFERQGDLFALTPMGSLLRTDRQDSLRAAATFFNEEPYRTHGALLNSVRTGETAFNKIFGMGHFEYLESHPDAAMTFNTAMVQMTRQLNQEINQLYDFSQFSKVVDVGGGYGQLVAAVLANNLNLKGALFDLASAVVGASSLFYQAGVADRCDIIVGDMFKEIPVSADAYILKSVIHDWDDELCVTILKNIRHAIHTNGKLLLVERIIDTGNEACWGKFVDLVMLVMSGGRERTLMEYQGIYEASGFTLTRTFLASNGFSIIEGIPNEMCNVRQKAI